MEKHTPLYGHTSEETAYLVEDYPYGRHRTDARFWLEKTKHGWRSCRQTRNPRTCRWNKPKKSTYYKVAACMYLDEQGHVHTWGLSEYAGADGCIRFSQMFPEADMSQLEAFVLASVGHAKLFAEGKAHMTMNGVVCDDSERDQQRYKDDYAAWEVAADAMRDRRKGLRNED